MSEETTTPTTDPTPSSTTVEAPAETTPVITETPAAPAEQIATPEVAETPALKADDDAVDYDELLAEDVGEDATPPAKEAAPPVETPAEVTPPAEPAPVEAPEVPETPTTPPVEQAAEAPAPTPPEAETPPQQTPEELAAVRTKHREDSLPELQKLYALTEDEAKNIDDTPSKFLPDLAAKLHYAVQVGVAEQLSTLLPQVIGAELDSRARNTTLETQFYTKWPALNKAEHHPTVIQAINAYRATAPNPSDEDIQKNAGIIAMRMLGLDQQQAVATPVADPVPTPHVPAQPGATGPVAVPAREKVANMFDDAALLGEEEEDID